MNALFDRADRLLDAVLGPAGNPLRHLGALSFMCFWTVTATGLWLYAGYDTSLAGAHASVMDFDANRWPAGSLARSLHRYASDALVAFTALHLLREIARRHFAGFRAYAWITGALAALLLLASGIGGYWLVADDVAHFSLTATFEWFDALPLFAGSLVRNFLPGEPSADRFFSLLVFLHIGIPLAMLAAMWIHIRRLAHAVTNPPARLAWPSLAALAALSLAVPAVAGPAMDPGAWPARVAIDWFFLFLHPAMYATSPATLWAVAGITGAALLGLPLLDRRRAPAAAVDGANCNGCARCFADCPFEAVVMVARTDARPHPRIASVDPLLCAGCGICAGACPSSTPFRRGERLVTGIDLPQRPVGAMREELERALDRLCASPGPRLVVFGCDHGAGVAALSGDGTATFPLLCLAQLPPSFVEYALRGGADGVALVACPEGGCEFRLGERWMRERLAAARAPMLRPAVPADRVRLVHAGPLDGARMRREVEGFRSTLAGLGHPALTPPRRKDARHVQPAH